MVVMVVSRDVVTQHEARRERTPPPKRVTTAGATRTDSPFPHTAVLLQYNNITEVESGQGQSFTDREYYSTIPTPNSPTTKISQNRRKNNNKKTDTRDYHDQEH